MSQYDNFGEYTLSDVNSDPIYALRGYAIGSYARLEEAMCSLFGGLCGLHISTARIIFFRITSSRVRDTIIEKLIKQRHGNTYSLFWSSLARLIDQVSHRRNEIVH